MVVAAAPSSYWFITRASGAVALVLLTGSVALGVASVRRMEVANLRFVVGALHRSVSLLAVVFVLLHVVTTLLDGFAPIGVLDVVIPFRSAYRPVWLGLGTVALDLAAAVTITSLIRHRVGYRGWRATHWLVYLSWPLALVHSYGTGTDPKAQWMLALTGLCVVVVLAAVIARVSAGWPTHLPMRMSALGAAALFPLGLVAWLLPGPLASGWADAGGNAGGAVGVGSQRRTRARSRPGRILGQRLAAPPTRGVGEIPRAGATARARSRGHGRRHLARTSATRGCATSTSASRARASPAGGSP